MSRKGRFPLIAILVILAVGYGVAHVCMTDVEVPHRVLAQMSDTMENLAGSLRLIANSIAEGEFVFVNIPVEDSFAAGAADQLPMLVNADSPLPEGYAPKDLVRMREYCDKNVVTIKGSEIDGEREAVDALMIMFRDAIAQGVSNWQINAGYRSVAYQQQLFDNKVYSYRQDGLSSAQAKKAAAKEVAEPGSSEHHTGLAFDVTVPGESFRLTKQCEWLAANCYQYGFIIRYTEDKTAITGFKAEPWHIRYVGQPHALIMQENGWCLEEYVQEAGR